MRPAVYEISVDLLAVPAPDCPCHPRRPRCSVTLRNAPVHAFDGAIAARGPATRLVSSPRTKSRTGSATRLARSPSRPGTAVQPLGCLSLTGIARRTARSCGSRARQLQGGSSTRSCTGRCVTSASATWRRSAWRTATSAATCARWRSSTASRRGRRLRPHPLPLRPDRDRPARPAHRGGVPRT